MEDGANLGGVLWREEDHAGAGAGEEEEEEDSEEEEEFEPTEDELVLHFLRPQLRGFEPRVAGAVAEEADPCGCAPWDLLARHGLRRRGRGYFFAPRRRRGGTVRRSPAGGKGGSWMHRGTKGDGASATELGVVVPWRRTRYCFYIRGGAARSSAGWVMSEYEITDPRCYRRVEEGEEDKYWVLCHVRRSSRAAAAAAKPRARRAHLWDDDPSRVPGLAV